MWKRILIFAIFLSLFIGGLAAYFYVDGDYSDGYRAGIIVKFSQKGYVFKTNEGQLQLGNSPELWAFTVEKEPEVLKQIEDATTRGYRVKIFYHEKYNQFDWRGDTKYLVYKVEKVAL